ncbi:glycosyltransferase family 4 protein [Chlorobaculum thiosulfatiphilum]|uniref:Glycosyltransferase family 4 protein n=1 Tax=Chlorobaculum thiosulfatiphilum TaxID=115852 RepID=A0A5C4S6C5_CHLTI|nr:glycosyltransferase family 4 protein [Chlorobaculum thiosulfatiphilum]TNJ39070.1 glycosyltransferase family 4 protein [Chlorobaculum thiosulfatiphilum]
MKKRTFVILCSEYPPFMGGIALWAENLLKTLTANGYEAVVLTHLTRSHKKKGVRSTREVRYLAGHDWQKLHWLYRLPTLLKYMATRRELILIAATWDDLQVIHRLKPLFRFKIYCASHGTDVTKHVFPRKRKVIEKINRIYRSVDLFMPVSRSLDTIARSMYPALRCPTLVLGCNVLTDVFTPEHDPEKKNALRKQFGIAPECKLLVTVGRMMAVKGFRHVIMAVAALRERYPDLAYMIVARRDEPESLLLDALVKELHVEDRILFQPPVDNRELPKILQASDIFVLTSEPVYCPFYQEEGLPRVIPEASACEIPVIASTTGGLPEGVRDGETGFVVPNGDQEALKRSICALLDDPQKSREMGRKGRKFVLEQFSDTSMTARILSMAAEER